MAITKKQSELRSLLSSNSIRRPLLTHLSADNSWLLSLPIPDEIPNEANQDGKIKHTQAFFHLLLDAWLTHSNTPAPIAPWLQVQYHTEPPAYTSIASVIDLIANIENAASYSWNVNGSAQRKIDAVVIGHKLSDHMNYDTLKQVDPSVPVFAADVAFPIVQSWKHFETVVKIPEFGANRDGLDWRTASSSEMPYLPSWLTVWRIPDPQSLPGLHWGICIIFEVGESDQELAECVIQSPHGVYLEDAAILSTIYPKIKPLALLHPANESWFFWWGRALLGAKNAVQVAKTVGFRYWISTHDEIVATTGLNKWFLQDLPHNGAEVVEDEKKSGVLKSLDFIQVGNGESILLI